MDAYALNDRSMCPLCVPDCQMSLTAKTQRAPGKAYWQRTTKEESNPSQILAKPTIGGDPCEHIIHHHPALSFALFSMTDTSSRGFDCDSELRVLLMRNLKNHFVVMQTPLSYNENLDKAPTGLIL